jgi:hypothetical protein
MIIVLHAQNGHAREAYERGMKYLVNNLAKEDTVNTFFDTMVYQPGAIVQTNDLGVAFELTNHIDWEWWKNQGVTKLGEDSYRSTSVGDALIQDNCLYVVERMGFKRIKLEYTIDKLFVL